jgi:hypothetical protein
VRIDEEGEIPEEKTWRGIPAQRAEMKKGAFAPFSMTHDVSLNVMNR